jgi:glycosyltransferase involved in cell wall biosynthesis
MTPETTTKVLVVSGEPIGETRAGPAVRALAIASEVSRVATVHLLSSAVLVSVESSGHTVYSRRDVKEQVAWADVIVFQGYFLTEFPWVTKQGKILVADLYAPFHLEHLLDIGETHSSSDLADYSQTVASVNWQLKHADFFLCASEKQRDFWLGQLVSMGRINPKNLGTGAGFRHLIDVAPFGIDAPIRDQIELKLRHQINAKPDDKVLIWGGGIYEWFDPQSLIRAMAILKIQLPEVKLFFLAVHHPNQNISVSPIVEESVALAQELGILEKNVFFNQNWVPFEERVAYFADADIGISTHGDHIESRFSFRTRMLDYIWAGLPIVASEGDAFAELIEHRSLGKVVESGNPEAIAQAIEDLLFTPGLIETTKENVKAVRAEFAWDVTLAPLVAFCAKPQKAADSQSNWNGVTQQPPRPRPRWQTAKKLIADGGVIALFRKLVHRRQG